MFVTLKICREIRKLLTRIKQREGRKTLSQKYKGKEMPTNSKNGKPERLSGPSERLCRNHVSIPSQIPVLLLRNLSNIHTFAEISIFFLGNLAIKIKAYLKKL
jgi:hypothetical protein